MVWEFLHRWEKQLRLRGIAFGGRDAATARVRDAFSEAGAWITDVHMFAGVQTVLGFSVLPERLRALEEALTGGGLVLDAESRAAFARAASAPLPSEELEGTLAVVFAQGDSDLKHEVPAVPG